MQYLFQIMIKEEKQKHTKIYLGNQMNRKEKYFLKVTKQYCNNDSSGFRTRFLVTNLKTEPHTRKLPKSLIRFDLTEVWYLSFFMHKSLALTRKIKISASLAALKYMSTTHTAEST
jgi:hypothetical protein